MKRTLCILLLWITAPAILAAQESFFPISTILGNPGIPDEQILDTLVSAGFNAAWMGGFTTDPNVLKAKLEAFRQRNLKAVVHYPMVAANPKYNTGRFAGVVCDISC